MTAHAERKCGELLRDMAERGEREVRGGDRSKSHGATLDQLGLDKHEASRFQQIAAVPQKEFDAHLKRARETQQPVTIEVAARRVGVTVKTLRRWLRAGCPQARPGRRGRGAKAALDVVAIAAWRAARAGTCGQTPQPA